MATAVKRQPDPSADLEFLTTALFESSVIATIGVSPHGTIAIANKAMLRLLGVGSIAGLKSKNLKTDVLSQASDWQLWENAMAESVTNVEVSLQAIGGEEIFLRGDISSTTAQDGTTPRLYGIFTDITASKQMLHALGRTARMEAVGNLTSGIAHDFNNLLTVLVGNLYLVAEGVRTNPSLFEKVKRARDAAKRGADLIRQLLSFARSEQSDSRTLDPGRLIGDLEPLLRRAVGSKIALETSIDADIAPIDGNFAQLESVIVNLTINARDAIDGSGVIQINASNVYLNDNGQHKLPSGEYVRLAVVDNGSGIPEVVRDKVFDPFFSTKSAGEGTGLGLSMVRWFTEQIGGTVDLQSRPGQGTTVSLLLPRSERPTADTVTKTMPLSTLPTGNESVLVLAEDEEIRSTIQQILEVLGYTVRLSEDLKDSFEILKNETIDLVMIDSTAEDIVEAVRKLKPSTRTIVIHDAGSCRGQQLKLRQLIKPFSLLELATSVRRALDGDVNE